MIFGHDTTSQNLTLSSNVFDRCGCTQNRNDRGAVAVMCPNGNKPSGKLQNNTFYTEAGCPAVNPAFQGCDDNLSQRGNVFIPYSSDALPGGIVSLPQLSFNPPSPDCTSTSGVYNTIAVTDTPNATIRYTLDGSRPTLKSKVMPKHGLDLPWPGPAVHVNVRAFKDGMTTSLTNGALMELNYVLCREAPGSGTIGPRGKDIGALSGSVDSVRVGDDGAVSVSGWAVDSALRQRGWDPVPVAFRVDGVLVATSLANEARPDLIVARVAPNADHGFRTLLSKNISGILLDGDRHLLEVLAMGTVSTTIPLRIPENGAYVCKDGVCEVA